MNHPVFFSETVFIAN